MKKSYYLILIGVAIAAVGFTVAIALVISSQFLFLVNLANVVILIMLLVQRGNQP